MAKAKSQGGQKKTVQMCSALKNPDEPGEGRCMLPEGHGGNVHDGMDSRGQRIQWPREATA
jgi:hypothetical protein